MKSSAFVDKWSLDKFKNKEMLTDIVSIVKSFADVLEVERKMNLDHAFMRGQRNMRTRAKEMVGIKLSHYVGEYAEGPLAECKTEIENLKIYGADEVQT